MWWLLAAGWAAWRGSQAKKENVSYTDALLKPGNWMKPVKKLPKRKGYKLKPPKGPEDIFEYGDGSKPGKHRAPASTDDIFRGY